jgi:hypothetical protein
MGTTNSHINYTFSTTKLAIFELLSNMEHFIEKYLINGIYNYKQIAGTKQAKSSVRTYFRCNFTENNKLTCSSNYTTEKTENNNFKLTYDLSHNHPIIYDKLRLPKSIKFCLIDEIKNKVPLEEIYDSLLESINKIVKSKKQLITMAYLRYLKN